MITTISELLDVITAFRELTQRRLDRAVGDCQVYWEHDAKQLLEKTKWIAEPAMDVINSSEMKT